MITNSIVNKKYLSIMVDRFFSRYQHEEQPQFVNFVKQWFKYAEESYIDEDGSTKFSFWRTLSNIEDFIDIDKVPNELLKYFMEHYANNFSNIIENIPFFVEWDIDSWGNRHRVKDSNGNIIYRYDNIRMFLKTSRKFFLSKGSYYSFMYLFKLFGGSLEIIPLDRDIIRTSDPRHLLSAPNPKTNRMSHVHGIDPDPYDPNRKTIKVNSIGGIIPIRDWWYTFYSYKIITDLSEEFYKPIVLEICHPAGMKCTWKEKIDTSKLDGWGYNSWGNINENDKNSWGNLLGISENQQVSLSTTFIKFNNTSPNLMTNYREIEIRNIGEQPLEIYNISSSDNLNFTLIFDGIDAGHTPIVSIPLIINFGETKTFAVRFNPKSIGFKASTIVIDSNSEINNIKNIEIEGYCV